MPTYDPPGPWAGPYPVAVTDTDSGTTWEAYGPNQLKKPSVVIEQAEDCCLYTTEVTDLMGVFDPSAFAPVGKSLGDTYLVCHPDGISMWVCDGTAWVLEWQKAGIKLVDGADELLIADQGPDSDAFCVQEPLQQCVANAEGVQTIQPVPKNARIILATKLPDATDVGGCDLVETGEPVYKTPDGSLVVKPVCMSAYAPAFYGANTPSSQLGGVGVANTITLLDGSFTIPNDTCDDICAVIFTTGHFVSRVEQGWTITQIIRLAPDAAPATGAGFQVAHQENSWVNFDNTNYHDEYGPRQYKMVVPPGGRTIFANMDVTLLNSGSPDAAPTDATLVSAPAIFMNIQTYRNDC